MLNNTGRAERPGAPGSGPGGEALGRPPVPPMARVRSEVEARAPHATLVDALERAARLDAPFLTLHLGREPQVLDARGALEGAHRYAHALLGRGVGRGDRVLVMTPTSAAFVHAFLGTMLAGAIPVPLASPMTLGGVDRFLANLTAVVEGSGARCLIASDRILSALSDNRALSQMVVESLCSDHAPPPPPRHGRHLPSLDAAQPAFIQYTSGTTGRPKGAVISQRAVVANTFAIARSLSLREDDVGASWLPLFHDMGLIGVVLTALCHRFPVHVTSPERFLMSPVNWLDLIAEHRATITAAPNFAYDLCVSRCRHDPGKLDSLRAVLNGAEPVQPDTLQRFDGRFGGFGFDSRSHTPVYGMAENTLAATFSDPRQAVQCLDLDRAALEQQGAAIDSSSRSAKQLVCVGSPVAGTSIAITGPEGRTLAEDRVGEVRIAGASLMDGYFQDDEATEAAIEDGWLKTGDLGFVRDGRLYLTGRAKEVIIKGGRNISPHDLEQAAEEVSGVVRGGVIAFGRPNRERGTDDVVVHAETRERSEDARKLMTQTIVGGVLASQGVKVDEVVLRPPGSLARTTSGKLRRSAPTTPSTSDDGASTT